MQKRILSIAIALFVFGIVTIYLLSGNRKSINSEAGCTELQTDTSVVVHKGEYFCIELSYPSGTNYYDYTAEFNKEQIEFISNEKRNTKEDCDGCAIIETFRFRAKKEAKTFVSIIDVSEGMQSGTKTDTATSRNDTKFYYLEIIP